MAHSAKANEAITCTNIEDLTVWALQNQESFTVTGLFTNVEEDYVDQTITFRCETADDYGCYVEIVASMVNMGYSKYTLNADVIYI